MPLSRTDENELLTALYGGVADPAAWGLLLTRLRRRTRADYAGMLIGRTDEGGEQAREWHDAGPGVRPPVSGWQARLFARDPRPHRRLRPERIYGLADFAETGDIDPAAVRRIFMEGGDVQDQRIMRVADAEGASLWLLLLRRDGDFGAAESTLMSALAPHLKVMLRNLTLLETAQFQRGVSEDAARRLGVGWLALDARSRVQAVAGHAERLLAAAPRGTDERLTAAAEDYLRAGSLAPAALRLSEAARLELLLLRPEGQATVAMPRPGAIGYLRRDVPEAQEPVAAIVSLYGLSPNEARLVWSLCRGGSIAGAAKEIGLTLETARNYSKRIYAKLGVGGQTELVRLVLGGVAPMA